MFYRNEKKYDICSLQTAPSQQSLYPIGTVIAQKKDNPVDCLLYFWSKTATWVCPPNLLIHNVEHAFNELIIVGFII